MGVHKLWDILSGAGRKVNLEALQHRMLAIDTSIWLMNFEHARDESGRTIANYHLRGLFHRICKLLYFNIRPVFIFDGATPEIKLRTVRKRGQTRNDLAVTRAAKRLLREKISQHKKKGKKEKKPEEPVMAGGFIIDSDSDKEEEEKSTENNKNSINNNNNSDSQDSLRSSINNSQNESQDSQNIDYADYTFDEDDDIAEFVNKPKSEEKQEINSYQTPVKAMKSDAYGGDIDSEVFESLPHEIQLEVLNSVSRDLRYSVKKHEQELKKASPSPTNFSQLQINRLLASSEVHKKMRQAKNAMAPDRQTVASEEGTEFIFVRNTPKTPETPENNVSTSAFLNRSTNILSPFLSSSQGKEEEEEDEIPLIRKDIVRNLEKEEFNKDDKSIVFGGFIPDEEDEEPHKEDDWVEVTIDTKAEVNTEDLFDASIFTPSPHVKRALPIVGDEYNDEGIPVINLDVEEEVPEVTSEKMEEKLKKPDYEKQLDQEAFVLRQQLTQTRSVRSISDELVIQCQELLQLFGVPYLVSPTEAEAQCAMLNMLDLVDGIVSDDSDVFLFGGKTVYKNFFNKQKDVECYQSSDVQSELGLDRTKLVHLALLLGSDYTDGVPKVGTVTALEILSAFPGKDGLHEFVKLMEHPDLDSLPKEQITPDMPEKIRVVKSLHKIQLPNDFPDEKVVEAYMNPQVDSSKDKFEFSRPDLKALREFAIKRFGWNVEKADELLLPVMKRYKEKDTQITLDRYFDTFNGKVAPKLNSDRAKNAISNMTSPAKTTSKKRKSSEKSKKKNKKN